jgi:hypothetical protein
MTDRVIDEVFDLVVHALDGGQPRVPVQVFPFRMTPARLAASRGSPWHGFWQNLAAGHDLFEATGVPPRVRVCDGRYVLEPGAAGYDGGMPVVEQCRPWLVGGVGPEEAGRVAAPATPGRLAKLLAEVKRDPARAAALGLSRSAGNGPRIRCKLSLPSCRRWVALAKRGAKKKRTAAN